MTFSHRGGDRFPLSSSASARRRRAAACVRGTGRYKRVRLDNTRMATIPQPHYFYRNTNPGGLEFVRPVLGSFTYVVADKTDVFPRHQHLNYQLIFARRGRYRCLVNDQLVELRPREVLIVKRGDWHEDIFTSRLRYLTVNFDLAGNEPSGVHDILFNPGVKPGQQVLRGANRDLWQLLERMQAESARDDHVVVHVENALLLQLFWWLVRSLPREHLSPIFLQQSAAQAFSQRLRLLFEHHLAENLSASALAAKLGVSVRTLTKRCREVAGRPPARAFMHYKMEFAAQALRRSAIPIKEISHRLGFQNQYHFSRVFRRHLGAPPSSYREVPK
jgi:AraC-like DNA-binding protein